MRPPKEITLKNVEFNEEEDEVTEEVKVGSLQPVYPTRWTVRVKSLNSIKENYKQILKLCDLVGLEATDNGIKGRSLSN